MYKTILRFEQKEDGVFLRYPDKTKKFCIESELKKCEDFCTVTFQKVYKSRTTGKGSQNNYFWQLVTLISNETGEDLQAVETEIKRRGVGKGYPYHISKLTGLPEPESMTKVNTVEMSYLIDTALEVCAFLGIVVGGESAGQ